MGSLPSHLIFLRRHSSHARVTRRRFCVGAAEPAEADTNDAGLVPDFALSGESGCQKSDCMPESLSSSSVIMAGGGWQEFDTTRKENAE